MLLRNIHYHTFNSDCRTFNDYQTFNTTYTQIYLLVQDFVLNTDFVTRKSEEISQWLWQHTFGRRRRHLKTTRVAPTPFKKDDVPLERVTVVQKGALESPPNESSPPSFSAQVSQRPNDSNSLASLPDGQSSTKAEAERGHVLQSQSAELRTSVGGSSVAPSVNGEEKVQQPTNSLSN